MLGHLLVGVDAGFGTDRTTGEGDGGLGAAPISAMSQWPGRADKHSGVERAAG